MLTWYFVIGFIFAALVRYLDRYKTSSLSRIDWMSPNAFIWFWFMVIAFPLFMLYTLLGVLFKDVSN